MVALATATACDPKKSDPATPAYTTKLPTDTVTFATATTDLAFYEVNLRAYNGIKFSQFAPQLDSIKALGCNTVWFMPVFPVGVLKSVGQLGSPYAVRDYTTINPEFGTLADFKNLVAQAHARKLNIVLDWVANHTAWDHAWITAHPEWYTKNSAGVIQSPAGTNWADVADLNYNSTAMRLEMIKSLKFWVQETDIDGFRCDAANMVPGTFWKQAIDSLKAMPRLRPLIFLAEGDLPEQVTAGFQMTYGWNYYETLKKLFKSQARVSDLFSSHGGEYASTFANAQRLRFTTNHDETAWSSTPMALFGGKPGAIAASVITVGLGGVPLVYSGQEVGTTANTPIFTTSAINWTANPDMKAAYKQMLSFRAANAALRTGALTSYLDNNVVAFSRSTSKQQVLVLVNIRNATTDYTVPGGFVGPTWRTQEGGTEVLSPQLSLPPYGCKLLVRNL
jgi:glycosidase